MTDLAVLLFVRYNRIMRGTFIGVLLVSCALVYLQYDRTLDAETDMLTQRVAEQAASLDAILKNSTDAVSSMRMQSETWYGTHPASEAAPVSLLRRSLRPGTAVESIMLDHPPQPWTLDEVGNLTGLISPSPSLDRELEMSLSLNGIFQTTKANLPDVTWVYYTSARRFINIYPWISSKDFFYDDALKQKAFFQDVEPQRNPLKRIIWTPAYVDEAGQGMMVTASAPVYEGDTFRGSVSLDLTLVRLNHFVRDWHSRFGALFIVNEHGQLLAHPTLVQPGTREIVPSASAFPASMSNRLGEVMATSNGKLVVIDGYYVESRAIQNAPFRLVLILPRRALVLYAVQGGVLSVLLLVAGLTLLLLVASRLTHREAIAPAQKLVRYIQDENRGSAKSIPDVPAAWRPWFRTIQNVFNAHTQLISIQQELDVARRMQQAIVPTRFPNLPELQMFARMIPAKEVGGDFYDYFWLSDTKVGMVIADVSGKGVPAALFMAVARTLLRATAPAAASAGSCLAMANDLLSQDNDATMFVTVFYGILDVQTGQLDYANGGHNPPWLIAPDGTVSRLPGTGGVALGVMEALSYEERQIQLMHGSTLLLYTDGVTEAFNPVDEAFGEKRLAEKLTGMGDLGVETLLDDLVESVHVFADGAPQSDDITCLAVRYNAPCASTGDAHGT